MVWPLVRRSPLVGVALAVWTLGCQRLDEPAGGSGSGASGSEDSESGGTFTSETEGSGDQGETADNTDCDPVAQTGCVGGQKCAAMKAGGLAYTCVDDPGGLGPEQPCTPDLATGIDGCEPSLACLGDVSGAGLCLPLCESESDCDRGVCIADAVENVPYCATECSPFEPSCPAPLQCRRDGQRFACKFIGVGDVGVTGDPCSPNDDGGCGGGFACLPGALVPGCSSDNCCTSVCDLSGADPCPAPTICAALLSNPAPGFEQVGACFVPA